MVHGQERHPRHIANPSRPVLLVGEQSAGAVDSSPLGGRAGRRLAALCGLTLDVFLGVFGRTNLFLPGEKLTAGLAGRRAADLIEQSGASVIVLLGAWSRDALLGYRERPLTFVPGFAARRTPAPGRLLAWCPHPSGRCRWWNDPSNKTQATVFWESLAGAASTWA